MKILYIINSFSWGGAEKLVFDLSQGIRKYTDWVGVVALYRKDNDTEAFMQKQLKQNGVRTYILNKKAGRDRIKSVLSIMKIIKQNNVDLVHGHCSVPMLIAKLAGKLENKKVVCTIHNTNGYSRNRERFTQGLVDAYVSIGVAAEDYMRNKLDIQKTRIHKIYNAIDVNKFRGVSSTSGFWTQYGGKTDELAILNVARVSEQKNQLCLLRAIKRCVDAGLAVKCYILGGYEKNDKTYENLQKYIIENRLGEKVLFLGMHDNVEDFLANADCFVLPSWYEGLSVAFLEAVMVGIPIVVADMPFVMELNDISRCAAVFEQNSDDLLAEILINHKYKAQNRETIIKFSQMFSMEDFVKSHYALYKCLLHH